MEALLQNLIKATGWSILHSLWQGAVIFALLLPTQLKAVQLSSKLKYGLAYTANCLVFICFVFTFLSVFEWPAAQQMLTVSNAAAAQHIPANFTRYAEQLFPYLVLLYGLGVSIQSMVVFQGYRKVQLLKKAVHLDIPEEWSLLLKELTAKLKISRKISFYLSSHVSVPLVIGYLKPVVLFPVALAAQMDIRQVEAILIHELSHIRRNDYFFNVIKTMIDTLLFFNPFIWLVGRFITIEREHACDDLVVTLTKQPLNYAHALLKLELIADKNSPSFALAATGKGQHLYQRIKRITDMKTNYTNSKQKIFAVSLTIATIFSLAWISPVKSEKQAVLTQKVKSNELSLPADTGKKATKKRLVIQKPNVPPAPPVPKVPPAPPVPKVPPAPPARPQKLSGIEQPQEMLELNFNADSIITPAMNAMITQVTDQAQRMALVFNDKDKIAKLQSEMDVKAKKLKLQFDSPEQRAKLEKYGAELQTKYKNSAALQERIGKLQATAAIKAKTAIELVNSPDFKKNANVFKYGSDGSTIIISGNGDQQKIIQSPEYITLKNKFDKDVQELIEKKVKN